MLKEFDWQMPKKIHFQRDIIFSSSSKFSFTFLIFLTFLNLFQQESQLSSSTLINFYPVFSTIIILYQLLKWFLPNLLWCRGHVEYLSDIWQIPSVLKVFLTLGLKETKWFLLDLQSVPRAGSCCRLKQTMARYLEL